MSYTLVSGYINIETLETNNNNNMREQTFMIYKENGQKLINLPIKKIIFIDYRYIEQFQTNIYTKLISINFEDMEIYKYYKKVLECKMCVLSPNPNKDTALYHIIQIAKTEFIKKAIELESESKSESESEEHSNIFAWIDFGICKIFSSDVEFQYLISNISKYITMDTIKHDMVKIPGCWKLNSSDINNDFTRVNWYFCGGFFIGYKNVLLEFEKQVKKELTYIIENENTLIFEVNIWFRLWRKKYILFDWYYGDHNSSIFVNLIN